MKNRPHIGVLLGAMLLEFDHNVFFDFWNFWFLDRVVGGPKNGQNGILLRLQPKVKKTDYAWNLILYLPVCLPFQQKKNHRDQIQGA